MYLDNIIILSANDKAWCDYTAARQLIKRLGLPEAEKKLQPPAKIVKWLGVVIDATDLTISIP